MPWAISSAACGDLVHGRDQRVQVVLDRVEIAVVGVGDLRRNVALADPIHVIGRDVERRDHGVEDRVHAAHDLGIRALELVVLAALGELPRFGGVGQPRQFLLQALQHDGHVVDGLLHLFVIALVGLGDQLVDLAVGDLRQDAVAFADGQQNRVQHGVDAAHDLGIRALELFRLAALGELPFLGGFGQPHQFLLQALQHDGDIVDRLLHLFVIALVGLGDQFVDFAVRDLRQDAVAFADGQQNRVQHGVDAAHDLGISALELLRLAALGELPFLGRLGQPRPVPSASLVEHRPRC